MLLKLNGIASFGSCKYDFVRQRLQRDNDVIPLQPRTIGVLEYLLVNRERVISRPELIQQVWGGTIVADNTVDYQIRVLRRALGESPDGQPYISSFQRRGWQFTESVTEILPVPREPESSTVEPAAETITRFRVGQPTEVAGSISEQSGTSANEVRAVATIPTRGTERRWLVSALRWISFAATVAIVGSVSYDYSQKPEIAESVQITNDGRDKWGPVKTGGQKLFFREQRNGVSRIVSVPITGGDPVPLPINGNVHLLDVSRDGKRLLVRIWSPTGEDATWIYSLQDGTMRLLGPNISEAAWVDSNWLSWIQNDSLYICSSDRASSIQKLAHCGNARYLVWNRSGGVLRYVLDNRNMEGASFWELGRRPRRLDYLQQRQRWVFYGDWSPDGRYFFYEAGDDLHSQIWVESTTGLGRLTHRTTRLTFGPGSWKWPTTFLDNSTLFALSGKDRQVLVSFDEKANLWNESWDGSSAIDLSYSPDGKWVAYVDQRDHSLWKCRPDGSERFLLAPASRDLNEPHWSRDGQRVAYMGEDSKGAYRIFVVAATGGGSNALHPNGEDQGVPTWAPGDAEILYGERKEHYLPDLCLHVMNVKTGATRTLAGTHGLWSPRWSPDGNHIVTVHAGYRLASHVNSGRGVPTVLRRGWQGQSEVRIGYSPV